jgi:hypothetical protein
MVKDEGRMKNEETIEGCELLFPLPGGEGQGDGGGVVVSAYSKRYISPSRFSNDNVVY